VSRFECGAVAELFLSYAKSGTAIEKHAHDAAVTVPSMWRPPERLSKRTGHVDSPPTPALSQYRLGV
jgi:hypothetical protein